MAKNHKLIVTFSSDTAGDDSPAQALEKAIELIAPYMVDNVNIEDDNYEEDCDCCPNCGHELDDSITTYDSRNH